MPNVGIRMEFQCFTLYRYLLRRGLPVFALAYIVAVVFAAEKDERRFYRPSIEQTRAKENYGTVVGIDLGTTYSV